MNEIILRLNYQAYFDNEEDIEDLLAPLDRSELLRAASYLINRSKTEKNSFETINAWFSNEDLQSEFISKTTKNSSILNVFSSLKLLTFILDKKEVASSPKLDKDEFELRLFKIYLLLNSDQDIVEERAQKNLPSKESDELLNASLLTLGYHDYDIQNYVLPEIFLTQLIKSIEFFQFIENHAILNRHLAYFLSTYKCETWQEWIYKLLNVIMPIVNHNNDTYSEIILEDDEKFEENSLFLNLFSIPFDFPDNPDFIAIRSNPLLNVDKFKYLITNKLFLIERIFKSVIFEFSLKINKEIEEKYKIKDFRSIYCDYFSEQVLLYKTTLSCFPKNEKFKKYSGEDFKAEGYSAEPDFYVRFKNKILLFESKDVILKGDEKLSRDYSILSSGLKEKFLKVEKNGKISKKAILQIIENIKRLYNKYYSKIDTEFDVNNIRIYPILIIHDRQFDAPELNRLLNKWFRNELDSTFDSQLQSQIKDLTIINIDTLILYQENFRMRGGFGLELIIDRYIEFTKPRVSINVLELQNNYLESSISFSNFCGKLFDKVEYKNTPKFIDDYISKLGIK